MESQNPDARRSFDPDTGLEVWLPLLLAEWRRRSRSAGTGPRLAPAEVERVAAALLRLQRGLTSGRELAGRSAERGYMDEPALLGAYLLYYWPVSWLEARLSLEMIGRRPRRVLDLGSGPGPVSAAFLDAGAEEVLLVDASPAALDSASAILASAGRPASTAVADLEGRRLPPGGPWEAIVASHLLNELWKEEPDRLARRLALVEAAAERLAPDGFLLVIEPALLSTSREALALRDALAARGWRLLAPCPSSLPCPALASGDQRTCHGEAAWNPPESVAALARKAGLDRQSVKWTWFAAAKPDPAAQAGLRQPVAAPSPDSVSGARVVSDPMLNKAGRLRYLLCTADGRLLNLSAKADSALARKWAFAGLRRHDLVGLRGGEPRENGLGLVEGSSLELEPAPRLGGGGPR